MPKQISIAANGSVSEIHKDVIAMCADLIRSGDDRKAEFTAQEYVRTFQYISSQSDPDKLAFEQNVAIQRNVSKLMIASARKACEGLEETQTQADAARADDIRQRYDLVPRDGKAK